MSFELQIVQGKIETLHAHPILLDQIKEAQQEDSDLVEVIHEVRNETRID